MLKSRRFLFQVDPDTYLEVLEDKFNIVTPRLGELIRKSPRSVKPYPEVTLANVKDIWDLNVICQGLNSYFSKQYEDFPFPNIRTEVFGMAKLGDKITRSRSSTSLGTSVRLMISWDFFDLIDGTFDTYSHGRRVSFHPYKMTLQFCGKCNRWMHHTEGACIGPGAAAMGTFPIDRKMMVLRSDKPNIRETLKTLFNIFRKKLNL